MSAQDYLDAILIPLGVGVLLTYHLYLLHVIRCHPLRTVVGANNVNRRAWVRSIMKDQSSLGVLAAQTLRNSIMGSTLQATTSITLASTLAAFLASSVSSSLQNRVHSIVIGSKSDAILAVKFFVVVVCFLMSFLCYMQAIRYTNHVIFIITIPIEDFPELTPEYVAGVLACGSNFQTLGTRVYHFALPLMLWIFGPIPMIACALISIPVMWRADFSTDFLIEVEEEEAKKEDGLEGDVESQRVDHGVGGFGGGRDEGETKRRGPSNGFQDED